MSNPKNSINHKSEDILDKQKTQSLSDRIKNIEKQLSNIELAIKTLSNAMESLTELMSQISQRNNSETKEDIISALATLVVIILSSNKSVIDNER